MKLRNPFPDWVRELWRDWWRCMECGENGTMSGGLELHHITGRDSNSPFNSCPLCKECHSRANHNQQEERKYFTMVAMALKAKRYDIKDDDIEFMMAHPHLLLNNHHLDNWLGK